MVRPTAHLLVITMLLASGRLLACGWECLDELAAPEVASCHTESAPATAFSGDAAHACLPDVAEPRVTVAKTVKAHGLVAAPLVTAFFGADWLVDLSRDRLQSYRHRIRSPHSHPPSVLRI